MWKLCEGLTRWKEFTIYARHRSYDDMPYLLSRVVFILNSAKTQQSYFILMRGLTALRKGEPKMHWDANQEKGLCVIQWGNQVGKPTLVEKWRYQIPEVAWFFMTDTLWNTAANITTTHTITVLHYIEPPFYSDKGTFFHSAQHSTAIRADSQQLLCNL